MESDYAEALRYLSSPAGSFWRWSDEGKIVEWTNGSTMAFREELTIMLERLAPRGLPPFDAVLLLVAATREYWAEDSVPLQRRMRAAEVGNRDLVSADESGQNLCTILFPSLQVIHDLPDSLIRSVESKADLASIVFEYAPMAVGPAIAKVVVDILGSKLNNSLPSLRKLRGGRVQTTKSLVTSLWPMYRGLKGISKESLELRRRTGLDCLPESPRDDVPLDYPVERLCFKNSVVTPIFPRIPKAVIISKCRSGSKSVHIQTHVGFFGISA